MWVCRVYFFFWRQETISFIFVYPYSLLFTINLSDFSCLSMSINQFISLKQFVFISRAFVKAHGSHATFCIFRSSDFTLKLFYSDERIFFLCAHFPLILFVHIYNCFLLLSNAFVSALFLHFSPRYVYIFANPFSMLFLHECHVHFISHVPMAENHLT